MTEHDEHPRRHRKLRSSKRLRIILMTLGCATLVLGAAMFAIGLASESRRVSALATGYLVTGCVVLLVRAAVVGLDRRRKRKYRKR